MISISSALDRTSSVPLLSSADANAFGEIALIIVIAVAGLVRFKLNN